MPLHNERREFTEDEPRVYNRWQPLHEQPVVENYEGPDHLLRRNKFLLALQELCVSGQPSAMPLNEAVMWAKELRKQGVTQVVVHGVDPGRRADAWQCGRPTDSFAERQSLAAKVVRYLVDVGATKVHHASGDALLSLEPLARR